MVPVKYPSRGLTWAELNLVGDQQISDDLLRESGAGHAEGRSIHFQAGSGIATRKSNAVGMRDGCRDIAPIGFLPY